jgi:hypothetical protein
MAQEREIRKESSWFGPDKEVIYEGGERVGEVKTEERGGFFGMGSETVKVEYIDGKETGYSREEERGGFLGLGSEKVQVQYDTDDNEVGQSRIEERGGFLGLGADHVRIGYDTEGNEVSQTTWENRHGVFGIGGERVKVTRNTANPMPSRSSHNYGGEPYSGSGSKSDVQPAEKGSSNWFVWLILISVSIWIASRWIADKRQVQAPNLVGEPNQPLTGVSIPSPPTTLPMILPHDWALNSRLSLKGLGPLRIGTPLSEVTSRLEFVKDKDFSSQSCSVLRLTGVPAGLIIMITNGQVSSINVNSSEYTSLRGARVGMTEEQLMGLYPGELRVSYGKYNPDGRYLTFVPKDAADRNFRMIFVTDGKRVLSFATGKLPEVEYVEGCL